MNTEVTDDYCRALYAKKIKMPVQSLLPLPVLALLRNFRVTEKIQGVLTQKNPVPCFKVFTRLLIFRFFAFPNFNVLIFPVLPYTDLQKCVLCCVFP